MSLDPTWRDKAEPNEFRWEPETAPRRPLSPTDQAEIALMGVTLTGDEAARLHELINQATSPAPRLSVNIPEFKSEAEEAAWWDSHPDETLSLFEQAAKNGALGRGTLARRAKSTASPALSVPPSPETAAQVPPQSSGTPGISGTEIPRQGG
jgi:hypothetical protein